VAPIARLGHTRVCGRKKSQEGVQQNYKVIWRKKSPIGFSIQTIENFLKAVFSPNKKFNITRSEEAKRGVRI
jgi:hypothetical protein